MFKPHPLARARKRSAIALIKLLLAEKKSNVLPIHRQELLGVQLWKLTEAETRKHETRFQSQAASKRRGKVKLRHDHVFQRSKMIDALEVAAERKVDIILNRAIGCTVTADEHKRLSKFDKEHDGWVRYKNAGIRVIDTKTGKRKI
jgi:hypothetical protein